MNTGSNSDTALLLIKPEAQKRLVELKDSNEYSNWEDIKTVFDKEFDSHVSVSALKVSYNKTIAKSITIYGPKENPLEDLVGGMEIRLKGMMEITDILKGLFKEHIQWLIDAKDLEPIQRMKVIGDTIRQNEGLSNTSMKQLTMVLSQIQQIKVEVKGIQWTEEKVHDEMNRLEPLRLQILEEDGKIAVIDRSLVNG